MYFESFELSALLYDFVALECRTEERAPPHTHSWADVEQDTADRDKKDNIRFDIWKKVKNREKWQEFEVPAGSRTTIRK